MFKRKNKNSFKDGLDIDLEMQDINDANSIDNILEPEEVPDIPINEMINDVGEIGEISKKPKNSKKKKEKRKKKKIQEDSIEINESSRSDTLAQDFLDTKVDNYDENIDVSEFTEDDVNMLNEYMNEIIDILGFYRVGNMVLNINDYDEDVTYYISKEKNREILGKVQKKYKTYINIPFKVDSGIFQVKEDYEKVLTSELFASSLAALPSDAVLHNIIFKASLPTDDLILNYNAKLDETLLEFENDKTKEKLSRHFAQRKKHFQDSVIKASEMVTYAILQFEVLADATDLNDEKVVAELSSDYYRSVIQVLGTQESVGVITGAYNLDENEIYTMLILSLTQELHEFNAINKKINLSKRDNFYQYVNLTSELYELIEKTKTVNSVYYKNMRNANLTDDERAIITTLAKGNEDFIAILQDVVKARTVIENNNDRIILSKNTEI